MHYIKILYQYLTMVYIMMLVPMTMSVTMSVSMTMPYMSMVTVSMTMMSMMTVTIRSMTKSNKVDITEYLFSKEKIFQGMSIAPPSSE